jgi:hypothetical protein
MRETNIPIIRPARATAPVNARNFNPPSSAKSSEKGPTWNGAVAVAIFVTIECDVSVRVTTVVKLAFVNVDTIVVTPVKKGWSVCVERTVAYWKTETVWVWATMMV